jgi:hypothetical protein
MKWAIKIRLCNKMHKYFSEFQSMTGPMIMETQKMEPDMGLEVMGEAHQLSCGKLTAPP